MKQTIKLLAFGILTAGVLTIIRSPGAHAASIIVNTDTHPSACTLDEAIVNLNDGAQTNVDCVETGTYGTDDTITIPEGLVTLAADLPAITKSVAVHGQGMNQSIISGAGTWTVFQGNPSNANLSFRDMRIVGFAGSAIRFSSVNLNVTRVEIDGSEASGNSLNGIINVNDSADSVTSDYSEVYVHNLTTTNAGSNGEGSIGILNGALGDGNNVATLKRVTIETLSSNKIGIGFESFSGFNGLDGKASFFMENTTISNVVSSSDTAAGLAGVMVSVSGDSVDYSIENTTITSIESQQGQVGDGAGILLAAGGRDQGAVARTNLTISNVILANNKSGNTNSNCRTLDVSVPLVGGLGSADFSLESQGGNLSDDNSCSSYFTQTADQNNVTSLKDFLAPVSSNGGYVPTIALLQGSPAIDAGVTVAGLTTDARGVTRPQGNAGIRKPIHQAITRKHRAERNFICTARITTFNTEQYCLVLQVSIQLT